MSFKLKSIYHMSLWGSYMSLYDNSGGDKGATERGARHTPQVHTVSTKKIESDHFFFKKSDCWHSKRNNIIPNSTSGYDLYHGHQ